MRLSLPVFRSVTLAVTMLLSRTNAGGRALGAQATRMPGGILQGTVIEARTGAAVASAVVELRSGFASAQRTAHTDERGQYRFAGVSSGDYELRVRALGFQTRVLTGSLGTASARISVGIEPIAVSLAPIIVERQAADLFARLSTTAVASAPVSLGRSAASFMSLDARTLTYDDVTRTIAPGEPDLMRALLRHPAVESRDDYTTALWIRGAPWDESLVTFDGVPLFNPLHAAGAVSALNLDGLGGVTFFPTSLSSESIGSASGQVAVTSRRGTSDSTAPHALSGLSMFSGSAALDGARQDGRADWMIAARRSHIDLVTGVVSAVSGSAADRIPYDFSDMIGRAGVWFRDDWRADVSALEEGDRLRAPIAGIVDKGSGSWGGFARSISVTGHLPQATVRLGAMWSGFASHLATDSGGPALEPISTVSDSVLFAVRERLYRPQPLTNSVGFTALSATWLLPDSSRGGAGVQFIEQSASDSTSGSWPHGSQVLSTTYVAGALQYVALWVDRAWRPFNSLAFRAGLRMETGGMREGASSARYAPSSSLRFSPAENTILSVTGARSYQYAQTLAPPGPGRNAVATTGAFWVIAGDSVPAARTDAVTIAGEQRLSAGSFLTIAAYARSTDGAVVADPHPGALVNRPLFVNGRRAARGLELSARHLGPRFTGSTSLVVGRSTIEAAGLRYDAPEDRRIAFRADGALRLTSALRAMLAFSAAGGVPFTRYHEGVVRPLPSGTILWSPPPRVEAPSSERSNPYRSIDAGVEGTRHWHAHDVTMYAQMKNITGVRNDAAYLNSVGQCAAGAAANCSTSFSPSFLDTRLTPLRFFPAAGVRIAF